MATKVAELKKITTPENKAAWITHQWDQYSDERHVKMQDWSELKQYLFATDTSATSNSTLEWENTTTLPKLCQIRDVLHSNYMTSLFPNDRWLKWEGHSTDSVTKDRADTITSYMTNKAREGKLRNTISKCLLDYIDYGNAFAMPTFESRHNLRHNELIPGFIGTKAVRISPEDIVFNPLADTIHDTFKIVRSIKTLGEIKKLVITNPENTFWQEYLDSRTKIGQSMSGISVEDASKTVQYQIEGFGNIWEYYTSEYVEVLEFYGDYHDAASGELLTDRMITIADRRTVVRDEPIPTYDGRAPIYHAGWRKRSDNLWHMGPLDNLVGMQYRIDHLENAKADAYDMAIHAPLVIRGDVEPFVWGPKTQIHLDAGEGDVSEIAKNLNAVITADNQIAMLEERMELFAGAPREAAGIRTPGEKTAFEVDTLQTAASRIFQTKVTNFEIDLLEGLLNGMFESAHRNFDEVDLIRVIDNDLGVASFKEITKDDITARGILRPVGARHFSQRSTELQNMIGVFSSPIGQMITPHTSSIELARYIEDYIELPGYDLFRPNIGIVEQQQSQSLINQATEDLEVEATGPSEDQITNEDISA